MWKPITFSTSGTKRLLHFEAANWITKARGSAMKHDVRIVLTGNALISERDLVYLKYPNASPE